MKYTIFKLGEKSEINDFLNENRDKIGKDSYWIDSEGGRLCFMFNDEFDPEFSALMVKKIEWMKQHEKICTQLADIEAKLRLWEDLPEDTQVGQKELSGAIGGMKGFEMITAKRGMEVLTIDKANYEKQLEILNDLIQGNVG